MNILKSKRFVVRKSLIGKNQVIEFVNKKGGIFQSGFKSKAAAEKSLAGYHANK